MSKKEIIVIGFQNKIAESDFSKLSNETDLIRTFQKYSDMKQRDPMWANKNLCYDGEKIGKSGCLVTCVSNIFKDRLQEIQNLNPNKVIPTNPEDICKVAKVYGCFSNTNGLVVQKFLQHFNLRCQTITDPSKIPDFLKNGHEVIAKLKTHSHFVRIIGYDNTSKVFYACDPGTKEHSIRKFGFNQFEKFYTITKKNQGDQIIQSQQRNLIQGGDKGGTCIQPPMQRWQEIQYKEIKSFHEVRHARSGRLAYEATTTDGEKVLFHNINNPRPDELTYVEKSSGGYTDQWKKSSKEFDGSGLKIKDIQTSGKKISIAKLSTMNRNNIINQTKATPSYQYGTAIASSAGNICANWDRMNSDQLLFSATVGSAQLVLNEVPVVGLGLSTLMAGYSIGNIISQNQLDDFEKVTETFKLVLSTALSVGGAYGGAQIGSFLGVAGGPPGVIVGGIMGAFIGSFITAKITRSAIETEPMSLSVEFNSRHKTSKNSYGVSPYISWDNIRNKVQSFILIARTKKYLLWIVKDIYKYTRYLCEDCQRGIEIVNGYKYIGPDKECDYIQFEIFGIDEENVKPEEPDKILDLISSNKVTVIQYASKKIVM